VTNVIAYAELHCLSNFTFLRGASSAKELFERARKLGYEALAITDECSLAGIVRAHEAAEKTGLRLIVGAEFALIDGTRLVLLCIDHGGYTNLCRIITQGRRASAKGTYRLTREDVAGRGEGLIALLLPALIVADDDAIRWAKSHFGERVHLAVELHRGAQDAERLSALLALAEAHHLTAVACGDVHMHVRSRRALQDTLTAIRLNTTVAEAGHALHPNGERHLRRIEDLAELYPRALLDASVRIAEQCRFTLKDLNYAYPRELVPEGLTPTQHLRDLTERGARARWPDGVPAKVRDLIGKELALIAELKFEAFFLTVEDIVRFARSRNILCQGRGSSANSVVCFCLGITAVDPARMNVLFERFLSSARGQPPDIDVDFEHERREEVIQYIYGKYGRDRTALAATVICYRTRSALRDVGKALGLPVDTVEHFSRIIGGWDSHTVLEQRLREHGYDPEAPILRKTIHLVRQLRGFPRHLSQHVGGFVISEQPLAALVPVENAAMPDRTIIQWDKDDLEAMKLLKVDVLALGMLSCIRRCLDLLRAHRGRDYTLATIPAEDKATYEMIQRADTVGVFQIESRAQMSMLPRLKPTCFYDLVIEVAIVRPGPIQGGMVHPYLRRRNKEEDVTYELEELRPVLERTLGIPLFQEQVMNLSMIAAKFTATEADELRRSMAAWKRHGGLEHLREKLLGRMRARGYSEDFCNRIFEQIKGFGDYGFPESHAASFAILAYASSWLKCHEPAAFACALLNSLPMGFYAPAQIVQDAQRHGVEVRAVDVMRSDWDCTLEGEALRLGLRQIEGLPQACAERIMQARRDRPFADVRDLVERAALNRFEQARLADADALRSLSGDRHRARWDVEALAAPTAVFGQARIAEEAATLTQPSLFDEVAADYARVGLSLKAHPLSLVRQPLRARRVLSAAEVAQRPHDARVRVAGLVTVRQRPGTASGVTFVTLEDETGIVNLVVWLRIAEAQRRVLLESRLLAVDGRVQRANGVQHVVAERLHNYNALLGELATRSRDFH
jgi:error-prone DNA polymerase